MADVFTSDKRSAVMAANRAKNTKPEVIVRRLLHLMGYRFRLHVANLPGKPDVVIRKANTIVQVKGCFWHGHHCLKGRVPAVNRGYWQPKILGNKARDKKNERRLRAMGWRVKTIWECQIRSSSPQTLHRKLCELLDSQGKATVAEVRLLKLSPAMTAIKRRQALRSKLSQRSGGRRRNA